jgi:hypothetical protein
MGRFLLRCPSSSCRTAQENGSSSGEDEFSCSIPGGVHAHLICRTPTAISLFPVPPQGKSTKPARPSALSKVYTAPQQPTSPPPPPKEAPRSPETKVKPPIDADSQPPSSPGSSEVKVTKSLIRQLAQVVAQGERKKRAAAAAHKASSELYDRVMAAQERVIKKHGLTGKQLARAEKAVDKQIFARAQAERALWGAEAVHLTACIDLERARVKALEVKLASMKRRLRRRKIFGLMRWV